MQKIIKNGKGKEEKFEKIENGRGEKLVMYWEKGLEKAENPFFIFLIFTLALKLFQGLPKWKFLPGKG